MVLLSLGGFVRDRVVVVVSSSGHCAAVLCRVRAVSRSSVVVLLSLGGFVRDRVVVVVSSSGHCAGFGVFGAVWGCRAVLSLVRFRSRLPLRVDLQSDQVSIV